MRPNAETEFPTKTCPINETLFSQSGVLATDSAKAWAATSRGLPLPLEGVASDFMFRNGGMDGTGNGMPERMIRSDIGVQTNTNHDITRTPQQNQDPPGLIFG